jgi:hypothetical protein
MKQMWFPAAFRLPEPEFTREQLDLLEDLIQLIQPTLSREEQVMSDERGSMARFLVDLGTGIWRIRRKIEGLSRMPKEIKDALYSLESTWASMSEGGVEILDHTGTIPLKDEAKVVEVREIPNLTRDQVVETIKPTIMLKGEVIQVGEVVMGRAVNPAQSAFSAETKSDSPPADAAEDSDGTGGAGDGVITSPEALQAPEGGMNEEASQIQPEGVDLPDTQPADEIGETGEASDADAPEALPADEPQLYDEIPGNDGEPEEAPAAPEEVPAEALPFDPEIPAAAPGEIPVQETLAAVPAEAEILTLAETGPEAEPEAKPKKKRAARKPKAEADEEPKPKRTRRKKKTDETTEVSDAG